MNVVKCGKYNPEKFAGLYIFLYYVHDWLEVVQTSSTYKNNINGDYFQRENLIIKFIIGQRYDILIIFNRISLCFGYFRQGFIPVMIELILEEERKQSEGEPKEDSSPRSKIDIKRVFLSDLMLLLNHNHNNCRYAHVQPEYCINERNNTSVHFAFLSSFFFSVI
jgi:signal peptidase I